MNIIHKHEKPPWNSAVGEPDLTISVIHPNPNFRFLIWMEKTGQKTITNSTFVSIPGYDPIRDGRPFKCKPHLDKLGTANQATAYNSRTHTIGKLHMSIVDDKIRPILLRSKPDSSHV